MIDISIIVPTYKPKDYLYECLESLRNQISTNFTYEVIIVLNGSDDSYQHQIEKYLKTKNLSNFYFYNLESAGVFFLSVPENLFRNQASLKLFSIQKYRLVKIRYL